ncbi:glycosyl transferase [Bacillus mycoides]|nr:glycosyl transferase [Bacillus mycoides]
MAVEQEYLFSVIVPVYNTEKFLRKCLDSILLQDAKNFEVIVVNDGSQGNCKAIASEYQSNFDNLRYIEKENGGLSSARNTGILAATGKYCCFIDSDDYIAKEYIQTITKEIECFGFPDLVVIGIDLLSEGQVTSSIKPFKKKLVSNYAALMKLFKMKEFQSHACTKIIQTSLLKENIDKHLFFPINTYYEDVATIYKWLYQSNSILLIPESLYKYNIDNPNSITNQLFSNKHFVFWKINIGMYETISSIPALNENYLFYIQKIYLILLKKIQGVDKKKKNEYISEMRKDIKKLDIKMNIYSIKPKNLKGYILFLLAYCIPNGFLSFIKFRRGLKNYLKF